MMGETTTTAEDKRPRATVCLSIAHSPGATLAQKLETAEFLHYIGKTMQTAALYSAVANSNEATYSNKRRAASILQCIGETEKTAGEEEHKDNDGAE